MLEKSDFFQADDIYKVFKIVNAVNDGCITDEDFEQYIGFNSDGRQGRYYRLAAEKLGLIENDGNNARLTKWGVEFLARPNKEEQMKALISSHVVFSKVINHFRNNQAVKLGDLEQYFIQLYPGSITTATRRFSTFKKYVEFIGFTILNE